MSMTDSPPDLHPSRYTSGRDRYVRFAEDHLGLTLAGTQKRILRAAAEHPYLLIQSGNGVGKSFGVGVLNLAFLYSNTDSENQTTSGSYSQLEDTMWRPMKSIWKETSLPGRTIDSNPPRLEIDDTWYWKAVSPRYPDDLEGRHAGEMLMVIEEADKPSISEEHFDSAESNVTDANDRMVAICNPPRGEDNIVYQKRTNPKWEVIQFSSFESHNVINRLEEGEPGYIPGLVSISKLEENWEDWNSESWPGLERARTVTAPKLDENGEPTFVDDPELEPNPEFREDLDERWYRRRGGIIPPAGAEKHRPWYPEDVRAAKERRQELVDAGGYQLSPIRHGIGVDIAETGGDRTAILEIRESTDAETFHLEVRAVETMMEHPENEGLIRNAMRAGGLTGYNAIDAVGEGSGVARQMTREFDEAIRFQAGANPHDDDSEYKNQWSEGLAILGQMLRDGLVIADEDLLTELFAAARTIEFERRTIRGKDVLQASSKEVVKERLGRSPDLLDAAMMAAWAASDDVQHEEGGGPSGSGTW